MHRIDVIITFTYNGFSDKMITVKMGERRPLNIKEVISNGKKKNFHGW